MGIIIKEQDILSKNPPNDVGFWSEDAIRNYQETHGINYGGSVFCRGEKPNREWSNDRHFGGIPATPTNVQSLPVFDPIQAQKDDEIEVLKATVQSMKELIEELKSQKPVQPLDPEKVSRHGLEHLDKRTKAYKEAVKAQS